MTLEGRVVRLADRIAYINHDIDDAERAGVLLEKDIPREITSVLGGRRAERIDTLVHSVVENSRDGKIRMDAEIQEAFDRLYDFMFEYVYLNPYAKAEERKVPNLIGALFDYLRQPENLPDDMRNIAEQDGMERAACDYIAGMTDHFALQLFQDIYVPKSWNI